MSDILRDINLYDYLFFDGNPKCFNLTRSKIQNTSVEKLPIELSYWNEFHEARNEFKKAEIQSIICNKEMDDEEFLNFIRLCMFYNKNKVVLDYSR